MNQTKTTDRWTVLRTSGGRFKVGVLELIAQDCGLSFQTVTNVMRQKERRNEHSLPTIEKVEAAADRIAQRMAAAHG